MSHNHRKPGKKLPQKYLQQAIIKQLRRKPGKAYSIGNLTTKLKTKNSKDSIVSALKTLVAKGKVLTDNKGKYVINSSYANRSGARTLVKQGRVDIISSGAAYVDIEGQEKDIYVPKRYVNGSLQGDIVTVQYSFVPGDRRPEGRITEVVERYRTKFIGMFQDFKKYGYVFVESPKLSLEVRVEQRHFNGAEPGDAVVVDVTDFGVNKRHELVGQIVTVLQPDNRNDYEMQSMLISNGFELEFSEEALRETEQLSDKVTQKDIEERKDLRDILTFTIDPYNAKDFDDAISYRKLENGNTEIGVHIADVTHFVKPNTILDAEGFRRSTSVYLVDRVCPMLPERISNELCSLRPHEDKFSFSAIFEFDNDHKRVNEWFGKSLIYSDRRFTYEEAQKVLDGHSEELQSELRHINQIAKALNEDRFKNGSINFDSDEVRFELDDEGNPIGIKRKVRQDAHKLIEEFMLLANKRVATFMHNKGKGKEIPFVYRIHDTPDPERLMELALLASEFGIRLNMDSPKNIAASLNSLSEESEKQDILSILKPMAIRSMAKAAYSSENIGHYGLGFSFYSHFTSPIRRYSDVLAHRILQDNLKGIKRWDKTDLEERCRHISIRERDAITAERESIRYKQVEYLQKVIGETFEGTIRAFIDKGMFIELVESKADGFVPFSSLSEDLILHPARIKVTGARSKSVMRIGDRIHVKVVDADLDKRQIELRLVEDVELES